MRARPHEQTATVRANARRARTPHAWLLLLAATGCSSYDARLLMGPSRQPLAHADTGVDAYVPATHPDAATPPDATAPMDAGKPEPPVPASDAGRAHDARVDPPMQDAGVDAGDAAADAAASSDAGCGVLDANQDCCPDDPNKTAPGACGCGQPDTDGDGDGTPDCHDGCPSDAMKTVPGVCGCGRPDADQGTVTSCAGLVDALVHRYRFDGTGTVITDSFGTQDGVLQNTQLTGNGEVDLAGGSSKQFVDLPNGLISSLTDATFEVWLTWSGGASWQRIFDFGDNSSTTEGNQGTGKTYLFLTPHDSGNGVLSVAYTTNGGTAETRVDAASALQSSGMHHVAVVVDDTNNKLHLYVDGASAGSQTLTGSLSSIHDINNWLGHSQFSADPDFAGSLHEFRIYDAALSAAQIGLSFADGPDPAYLEH
jgi:hypothetical protein